ncbi:MAG TPA: hypothetical protein VLA48_03495 [Nitrososphaeraceae archaeon]|nr:hypothetical protein [Nitrososphaeraceae archaeon]
MIYLIIGFYLLGCVVHYVLFMKQKDHLIGGWGLVVTAFYFSLISWIAVIITLAFISKSEPPKWLTLKKK